MKLRNRNPLILAATTLAGLTLALSAPSAAGATETYNTAGTFNWVCPPGVTAIQVECWGGGGAGGAANNTNTATSGTINVAGGGGAGGAYARKASVPVTSGTSYTITIPAAATAAANSANGTRFDGGTVTFVGDGGETVTAVGGQGGATRVANTTGTGAGGTGSTTGCVGDVVFAGGSCTVGTTTGNAGGGGGGAGDANPGGNTSSNVGGAGGVAGGGVGGTGPTGSNNGNSGGSPGIAGGGSGGRMQRLNGSARAGGAGGLGQIVLTYTAPANPKANNADDLNLGSSWTLGAVPASSQVIEWEGTVTGPNTTLLGADLTFSGIRIANPGGMVTINPGNTLTLGAATTDIDLSAATQDLTLNCDLALGAANVWDVAVGRTLTVGGAVSGTAAITKQGDGMAVLSGSSTYTGATTVSAGSLVFPTGSTFSPGGTGGVSGKLMVTGAGAVATLAGTYTATGNGDAYYEIKGDSLLNFSGTASLSGGAGIRVGEGSGGTMNMTAGSLAANMNSGSNLVVGRSAGANGTLNLSGGNLTISNAGGIVIANTTGNAGVLTVSGTGRLTLNSSGTLAMGPGTATLNLNAGGTFTLGAAATASGTATTINFNGGTLQAGRSSTTFLPTSLSAVNILAGGAVIDTNGYPVTLPGALLAGVPGDGGLTKTGANTLILAGANTYTGTTNVTTGTLKFSTAGSNVADVLVASGAGAGVQVAAVDAQFSTAADLGYGNNSTLVIDYGSTDPSKTVAPLLVDNLTLGSGLALRFEGDLLPTLAVGQTYPLVAWTTSGPADGSAFTGGLNHRLAGTFGVSGNTLSFTVTANSIGAISWNTGNGVWDTASVNWLDANAVPAAYADPLDEVLFGDAAGASGNPVITLNTTVSPTGVKMNSTGHDYTITGNGAIAGTYGLTLDAANSRTLTLTNANTYTGPTAIAGGTLSLGDGGSLNPAGALSIAAGGTFAVNQSDTVTQGTDFSAAAITGAGGFTQAGSGTTILNAANTYSGSTVVSSGTLQATVTTAGNGLGTSAVSIGAGSILLLDSTNTTSGSTVTASNAFTGTGLLKVRFADGTNPRNLQMPTMAGFAGTIQLSAVGVTADKWNALGVGATGASLIVEAGNTLYVPSGTPGFTGITLSGAGNSEGRGAIRLAGATLGGDITLAGDATINLDNAAAVLSGNLSSGAAGTQTLTLGATGSTGGTLRGVIGGGTGTLNLTTAVGGTYTLTNANTYTGLTTIGAGTLRLGDGTDGNDGTIDSTSGVVTNGTLTFNRFGTLTSSFDISGTGGVSKTGVGTQTLSGTNTYTGNTIVNNGTLVISGTTNTGAGTLQVGITTGPGTLIVATGGSFTTSGALTLGSGLSGHTLRVESGATLNVGSINNPWAADYLIDGTLNATGNWTVSTNAAAKVFAGAGTISAAALNLGNASTVVNYVGTGTIQITNAVTVASNNQNGNPAYTQSSGTLNAGGILLGDNQANTAGSRTFNLNGGRVNLGSGGIATTGTTTATRVVNLGAGTLGASADWVSSQAITLTDAVTGTTINTLDSVDSTTGRTVTLSGPIAGTGALTKAGAGTLTLSGANTYSGATTVSAGTLALVGGSQASPIKVAAGASLGFTLGSPTTSTGTFNLSAGTLKITGAPTDPSYTLIAASAGITGTPVLDAPVSGYGLQVEGGTVLKLVKLGYAAWAATNAPTGGTNGDYDGDGVTNGVEYVLGGNKDTNDIGKLPKSSTAGGDLLFTFVRDQQSIDGSTVVSIEVSTDLAAWANAPSPYAVPDGETSANPGVSVVKNAPASGFDTVTLRIPRAPDAAKFGRLKVTVP
jgi:autotransporter-associated beta strand protein